MIVAANTSKSKISVDPIINSWLKNSMYYKRIGRIHKLQGLPWESNLVIPTTSFLGVERLKWKDCGRQADEQMKRTSRRVPVQAYSTKGQHVHKTHYVAIKGVTQNAMAIEKAGKYAIGTLDKGDPVKTFINHGGDATKKNYCGGTHVVVVVAYGMDQNGFYFRFFDNGTSDQTRGTHPQNLRIYYEPFTREFKSIEPVRAYTFTYYAITQFRLNKN